MEACSSEPTNEQADDLLNNLDTSCVQAAKFISEAHVFFLCTGAGFSADSGLAIYADVAKIGAYASRGLDYYDICQPTWLRTDQALFWVFWRQRYNDYRSTAPHAGYEIIDRWAERFRSSSLGEDLRRQLSEGDQGRDASDPYLVEGQPGAFFVFTSNVDAHHFDWFRACEIRECHGNTELYQCGESTQCQGVWRAPLDLSFDVDKSTMLAKDCSTAKSTIADGDNSNSVGTGAVPRLGRVRRSERTTMLRHMGVSISVNPECFDGNYPKCRECFGSARPAILMFGDGDWQDVDSQQHRYESWQKAVVDKLKLNPGLRVAVLEIGAGGNVTTVRQTSEHVAHQFAKAGADVRLIRVNPDLPLGDTQTFGPGGPLSASIISIMGKGLESLHKMDAAMPECMRGSVPSL